MGSSLLERGGSVGTNNPGDNNLKMQFWTGDCAEATKHEDKRKEGDFMDCYDETRTSMTSWVPRQLLVNEPKPAIAA